MQTPEMPDKFDKFKNAMTLIQMIRDSKSEEIRQQHVNALERILVQIEGVLRADG